MGLNDPNAMFWESRIEIGRRQSYDMFSVLDFQTRLEAVSIKEQAAAARCCPRRQRIATHSLHDHLLAHIAVAHTCHSHRHVAHVCPVL